MARLFFALWMTVILSGMAGFVVAQEPQGAAKPSVSKESREVRGAKKVEKREKPQRPAWNPGKGPAPIYGFHGMPGRGMEQVFKSHPEYQKLVQDDVQMEKETRELAKKYRKVSDAEKPAIQDELRQLVSRHFKVRQERRLYEVKLMEERIQKIRNDIEERGKKLDRIVEKRLDDLLDSGEDLRF
ncbi:MAG: hypothetical protein Q4D98_05095 [Planctomycetia bacterium]|nr:hypothetical protein [Planctomycetia bacterium]